MVLRRLYPWALALIVGVGIASFVTYRYYHTEPPFFVRLKSRKKRVPPFKLHHVQTHQSGISADLISNNARFSFTLNFQNEDIIHVQINDATTPRFVPEHVVTLEPHVESSSLSVDENNRHVHIRYLWFIITISCDDLEISIYKKNILILTVNPRKSLQMEHEDGHTGVMLDFMFTAATCMYGLPQHAERLRLRVTDKAYRLYNTDRFRYSASDHHQSLYGAVPIIYGFRLAQTTGLLWLNASDTYVDIEHAKKGIVTTFCSESGAVDFYIMTGSKFKDCVKQNTRLTGTVPLPPLFALGYQQCRYSYMTQEAVAQVSDKFDQHKFPLDAVWMDIDCTDDMKYFTWNPHTYPDPNQLLQYLDEKKRKAVVIVDPHLKVDRNYSIYDHCEKEGFLVMKPNRTVFKSKCWPGTSAWIDFLNPRARQYYASLHNPFARASNLHIWNDMNEPALFETVDNSMPKHLLHYGDWKHGDVHNLYGFYQTMATYEGLLNRNSHYLRPFVLTRSHFAGSQRFAAIWTGDNTASWEHLKLSIPMCLTASISGFSLCGADIGGFIDHPTEELLQRWYQTGAWLPFFRGHSNRNVPQREPYLYSKEVQERIRTALEQRYRHILYWYTLFWKHQKTLEPVIRPMIYQYSLDPTLVETDEQFLVGDDVLVCPVTEPEQHQIEVYLPGGEDEFWYYLSQFGFYKYTGTGEIIMSVNMDTVPVFYRGGSIIPIVETPVKSSAYSADSPLTLYVFCDKHGNATGTVYVDDGESFDYNNGSYVFVKFHLEYNKISNTQINEESSYPEDRKITLTGIRLYGSEIDIERAILQMDDDFAPEDRITIVKADDFVHILNINVDVRKNFVVTLTNGNYA